MLTERPQGSLPSTSEVNPRTEGKEQCQAITLRSGKIVENPTVATSESKEVLNK